MSEQQRNLVLAVITPILLTLVFAFGGTIWYMLVNTQNVDRGRIAALEAELASARNTLSTITENQRNASEDRTVFQEGTSQRLDRMEDVLIALRENMSALVAVQQDRESRDMVGR